MQPLTTNEETPMGTIKIEELILPTNPTDIKNLKIQIEACVAERQQIKDKQSFIRDEVAALSEKYSIPKKILNKSITVQFNANYDEVAKVDDEFQAFTETVFNGS